MPTLLGLDAGQMWILHGPTYYDMKNYKDWRQMADWIAQNDQRGTEQQFNSNEQVKFHIRGAGGDFEAAVMRGGMYDLDDLKEVVKVTIADVDYYPWDGSYDPRLRSSAGELMTRIIAYMAMSSMSRVKPHNRIAFEDTPEFKWAWANVDALEHGEKIFPLQAQVDAFQGEEQQVAPAGSTYELDRPSIQAGRLFGNRRKLWYQS